MKNQRKGGLWFVPWHGILYEWDRNSGGVGAVCRIYWH